MTFHNNGNISIELDKTKTNYVSKEFAEKNKQLPLLFAFASNSTVEILTKDCKISNGGFTEFKIYRDELQNESVIYY